MAKYAKNFFEAGYSTLIPDLRGHGDSQGDYIGMGWHDRIDIMDWIDNIIIQDSQAHITLFGVSMGAATVLNVSGEPLSNNVKSVIADCGYTSTYDIFSYQLKQLFGLPSFPIMNFSDLVTRIRAGYSLFDDGPIDQVKKANFPIFLIHGDEDSFVPYEMVNQLYDNINSEKDLMIVKGAGHSESAVLEYDLYWQRVLDFSSRYI
jgi:fermentation-respiration switch protein FrsA (DUF1100 family)